MSDWSGPSEQLELRELSRETAPAGAFDRRWYAAAFAAGVVLVCVLGFATDLFDSGPTSGDVSAAYRDGLDRGTAAAEAYWQEELEQRWWAGYKQGKSEGSNMAPALTDAMREGFSWDGGYEAGLKSPDVDVEGSYRQGWMIGYQRGWAAVRGEVAVAPFDSEAPGLRFEWGGEP